MWEWWFSDDIYFSTSCTHSLSGVALGADWQLVTDEAVEFEKSRVKVHDFKTSGELTITLEEYMKYTPY